MTEKNMRLLVSAGEASGDERAAEVITALRDLIPDLEVFGMGGDALRDAGAEIIVDIKETAVFGLLEAIVSFRKFIQYKRTLESAWLDRKPDLILLVDFGGFNLRLARTLKRHGAQVTYYISPQVWASRPGRIRWVERYVDLMMVLFEFEERLYRRHGVNAVHTGHPLVGIVESKRDQVDTCRELGFDPGKKVIGLLPGSRESEVNRLLPVLLQSSDNLSSKGYNQQFIVAAPGRSDQITAALEGYRIKIVTENRYDSMAAADLLILASGTAALESALLGVPAVVVYKSSWVTSLAAKFLLKVPYVSLPNIILEEEVFPELLQRDCVPGNITSEALKILEEPMIYDRIRNRITEISKSLGGPGAAERAAGILADFLSVR